MESLVQDLRFGLRTLRRSSGFTLIAVLTLALGIGANVSMMSLTSALLLRELPYREADRVMVLWRENRSGRSPFSIPTFRDWYERNRAFEALAMYRSSSQNLTGGDGEPEYINSLMVSAEFTRALGLEPVLGRSFRPEDDQLGAGRTVMLDHELWQQRFGSDPGILGKAISLDGEPYTVIGVLPPHLRNEPIGSMSFGNLLLPLGIFLDRLPAEERAFRGMQGVGRLKPDVTFAAARQDMARILEQLASEHPSTYENNRLDGTPIAEDVVRDIRPVLLLLLAMASFVLLIVCANLINLLLTRIAYRERELATRTALGAGRGRLIRQLLMESLLLSLLGGTAALVTASFCLRLLPRITAGIARVEEAKIDGPVLALTLLLSLVTGLLIGLIPALRATRGHHQLSGALTRSAVPHQRLRKTLIGVEVALALILLIGAGLMLTTLNQLRDQDPGFEPARLLTLQVVLPQWQHDQRLPWMQFFHDSLERLRALPDVEETAVTTLRTLEGFVDSSITGAGDRELPQPPDRAIAIYQLVSPRYFRTMGIPLLAGREFNAQDDDRRSADSVVVISESLARHFWPDQSPLGKRFSFEFAGTVAEPIPRWRRSVGVVGDVRHSSLRQSPRPAAYAPYLQHSPHFAEESPPMTLIVKTRGEPLDAAPSVRTALREIAPQQPFYSVLAMSELVAAQLARARMGSWLLSIFAALALILAMVGVYGVVAYTVAARTREFGTRMAFGANPSQILGLLLKESLSTVAAGIAAGLLVAALVAQLLSNLLSGLLYGVAAIDPLIYLTVALLLSAAAMLATLVPAWWATRIRPAQALRYE